MAIRQKNTTVDSFWRRTVIVHYSTNRTVRKDVTVSPTDFLENVRLAALVRMCCFTTNYCNFVFILFFNIHCIQYISLFMFFFYNIIYLLSCAAIQQTLLTLRALLNKITHIPIIIIFVKIFILINCSIFLLITTLT